LHYYQELMRDIRAAIETGLYTEFQAAFSQARAGL
jgi:queuine/archaeosine tRNA-ribosyltransferase